MMVLPSFSTFILLLQDTSISAKALIQKLFIFYNFYKGKILEGESIIKIRLKLNI